MSLPRIRLYVADFDDPPVMTDPEVGQLILDRVGDGDAPEGMYSMLLVAGDYARIWAARAPEFREELLARADQLYRRAARDTQGRFYTTPEDEGGLPNPALADLERRLDELATDVSTLQVDELADLANHYTKMEQDQRDRGQDTLIGEKASQSALDAEEAAREAADNALSTRVDGKADTTALDDYRTEADQDLIDGAEATARSEADNILSGRIDAEERTRGAADTRLEGFINSLQTEVQTDRTAAQAIGRIANANRQSIVDVNVRIDDLPSGGTTDLSAYRTSSDQDIIDNRHTQGILLARQEASTADGKAVAAQEDADDAQARLDAVEANGWVTNDRLSSEVAGRFITAAQAQAISDNSAAIAALPPTTIADPVVSPDYWVDDNAARTFTVHFDAAALALTGAAKVRLVIQGNTRTVNVAANQHTYDFTFDATSSTNISGARRVGQTVRADTFVLDASDAQLHHVIGLLRVVAEAPSGGVQVVELANEAAYTALAVKDPNTIYYVAA